MAPEGTSYLGLEPYDIYWGRVRDMYAPFENGMKSGTARVFDHQIPGEKELSREKRVCLCVLLRFSCVLTWRMYVCMYVRTCLIFFVCGTVCMRAYVVTPPGCR